LIFHSFIYLNTLWWDNVKRQLGHLTS